MNEKIKVFGAALDIIDLPIKIQMKRAYLEHLAKKLIVPEIDFQDPYECVLKSSTILKNKVYIKSGRLPIESFLTPKPKMEDFELINPINIEKLLNSDIINTYSKKVEDFVNEEIFPGFPLMIGVDHSLSGGVLKALTNKYNAKDTIVVVFDAHFDSISSLASLELIKYAKENSEKTNTLFPNEYETLETDNLNIIDKYTCASFLSYLIEWGVILPENLIIFGCQDYPNSRMRSESDPRVRKFVDQYLNYEKMGVTIIPADSNRQKMIKELDEAVSRHYGKNVYISIDVDVCLFKGVLASRFINAIGVEIDVIIEAIKGVQNVMGMNKLKLIGLDFMEIETYMFNKVLKKSGKKDNTIGLIDKVLKILIDNKKK